MPLQVEQTESGMVHAQLVGEVTIRQAAELQGPLAGLLGQAGDIDLDLSQVSELDSAGVQLLWWLKSEGRLCGRSVRLVKHSPVVVDVLDLLNMIALFGDPVVLPSRS